MIVITGASSGLGAALAQQYSAAGNEVCLVGRSSQRLARLSESLPGKSQWHSVDLTCESQVAALFDSLSTPPTSVLHCAGSGLFGAFEQHSEAQIRQLLDNNVLTAALLLQQVVSRYRETPMQVGVVMSTAALKAKANEVAYCGAKWAVRGMLESLRAELKASPLRLVGIYPGGMDTGFWQHDDSRDYLDASVFMSADDAAAMVIQGLAACEKGFISDITISRG
ncbi:SDR family NAD(P)-dependent oxidoreductase [Ferrimonas kyonanensis]|uniref:SDR family NAD(P)-dependent oxidoreductase n=1 Tax=Ferrimonas kyonanensis TaxID=364763 RepID=UPI00042312F7|nr:SDR family NAD(P)-dependent oxidoreductase [Ferrimonas kyonanensis]